MLIRKQILLDQADDLYIKAQATKLNLSYSRTIRQLIEQSKPKRKGNLLDYLASHSIKGGPKNLSRDIDKYLYRS